MIPPVESLVKYDKPVLVSSNRDKSKGSKGDAFGVDKKGKALQTEDILNAILPPRWELCAPAVRPLGSSADACKFQQAGTFRFADTKCGAVGSGPRTANCGFSTCRRSRQLD
jgi:hypothetical protein